ncbi:excalibur calcium-binding domain-containing protein [Vogesella indigofera]|uniref:excalibur calcium-binding domain-containing protein n=1 Tax=Vogesella indigofera TaxID=45465 RepID=UPI00234E5BDA|nr:cold shock domain-containing protein [Vogesella indigofera]MDC7698467.1 excalibur calcium-binding domain-containing protein [Vogesella indigofera]
MLYHGTISRWHDDKGFGFITQDHTREELFFDLSDCPPGGVRPQVGFVVYFQRQQAANGKVSARQVQGKVFTAPPAASPPLPPLDYVLAPAAPRQHHSRVHGIVLLLLLTAGVAGYASYAGRSSAAPASRAINTSRPATTPAAATAGFRCDGRQHCSQMNTLQEAAYFLQHCPDTRMDGDGDGQPCETQFAD